MSTKKPQEDDSNIAVSRGELLAIVKAIQDKINADSVASEQRTSEQIAAEGAKIRQETVELVKALAHSTDSKIENLTDAVRTLAQRSGERSGGSIIDTIGDAIKQYKSLTEEPTDALTSEVEQYGKAIVRGSMKELLTAQKKQVRGMLRRGALSADEITDIGITDALIDGSVNTHGRI